MVGRAKARERGNQAHQTKMGEMRRMIENLLRQRKDCNDKNVWLPIWRFQKTTASPPTYQKVV